MLDMYGGTMKLFEQILPRCGIKVRFVPYHDIENAARYLSRKTRMLFLESPTNPTLRCVDLAALCELGRKRKVCVVVDNTFATPVLQKPLELGADIVIHSATKYLGGHSDITAACWPDRESGWIGAADDDFDRRMLDPGCAYLLLRGLKTLDVRVERACRNAVRIAEMLQQHPKIARCIIPGLRTTTPMSRTPADEGFWHDGLLRSARRRAIGGAVYRSLTLWYLAASLGGVESTVSYPVLASHTGLSAKQLKLLGVSAATVRLSVGIEDSADLIRDLEQALAKA